MTAPNPAAVPPPARPALDRVPAGPPPGPADTGQFGILFVCTGNLCRSVLAERLARRGLQARLGAGACRFRVASAGTAALDGCPAHPYTAEALAALGADASPAASHAMTAADIDAADLILAAGREHTDAVLALRPRASRRAYLLREFARLAVFATATSVSGPPLDQPPAGRLPAGQHAIGGPLPAGYGAVAQARCLVAEAAQLRGLAPYVDPAEDEIADPASNAAAFLDCARVIDAAVSEALDALCRGVPRAQYRGKHAR